MTNVTREELLAEIVAMLSASKPRPPEGAFTAREIVEASGSTYETIRHQLGDLYKQGKLARGRYGLKMYYWKKEE